MITQIKIPARWHCSDIGEQVRLAIFNLGVGPCKKTVTKLDITIDSDGATVYQVCSDTEQKAFFYPMHLLTGRIEITEE